jgi:putative flavoprotein involved in K+ transport
VPHTTTVIIGAGQAGLAMSYCLSQIGIDHVVFERGEIAERWRRQSWDSLHLLTPNWMTRLPGYRYDGAEPDGFMSVTALVRLLERYAASLPWPVLTATTVRSVERVDDHFLIVTSRGIWSSASVVVATGHCALPHVPAMSRALAPSIVQIVPAQYRHPDQLPPGGVLVVGASSTGLQLADEIQRSGRQVTLAVGRHTRLPRSYRGRDILWWLDQSGALDQHADTVHDLDVSRRQPSLQLVGRSDHASLDLSTLHANGVRLVGRLRSADGCSVSVSDDLVATTAAADIKMAEVLTRVDRYIERRGLAADAAAPFEPTWPLATSAGGTFDLKAERISTVIWATGYRRSYPWLHVPVLDERGEIVHHGGMTAAFGLYVLGMNFQRRRNSSFIDGVGADAWIIAEQIAESIARVGAA